MNAHTKQADVVAFAQPVSIAALQATSLRAFYARLYDMEAAARALSVHIIAYRAIPAFEANDEARAVRLKALEEAMDDMRKVLNDE